MLLDSKASNLFHSLSLDLLFFLLNITISAMIIVN